MGLWILQATMRTWQEFGLPADLDALLQEAAAAPAIAAVVDVDDMSFFRPGDMPVRNPRSWAAAAQRIKVP